ncbi:MAG: aspartate carbamoyltransferase, partial [Candidatus Omnitrophica bacterium]|nr:aspartate carbamoyltransferase [Candidatus Omnitrophota bacterium]
FTIKEKKGDIKNLKVSIIGDIAHSRVARSNIWALTKLGAKVTVCGPKTLIPKEIEKMGVAVTYNMQEALKGADVLNVLRIQMERQKKALFPSVREYIRGFGVTKELLGKYAKEDVVIMHPGPINRGIELSQDAADGKYSVILEQVTNGVAVRMAVLFLVNHAKLSKVER